MYVESTLSGDKFLQYFDYGEFHVFMQQDGDPNNQRHNHDGGSEVRMGLMDDDSGNSRQSR